MSFSLELAGAARAFLDHPGAGAACMPFEGEERRTWAYWPTDRRGARLADLDRAGTKAAHRLVALLLPPAAFAQMGAIMALDEVLDRLEGWRGDRRHRDDYWLSVFGSPGEEPWGLRFEGHHVSLHATCAGGEVRLTPLFLGANPATTTDRGRVVVAPLRHEEEMGFEVLHALTPGERDAALEAQEAPDDIRSRNDERVDPAVLAGGVRVAALNTRGRALAEELVAWYLARFPAGVRVPAPDGVAFAWAGADRPGVGHYYRLAGPSLLIELDNTQDGANHVHTVVREPGADFGYDVLADHLHREHGAAGPG